MTASEPNTILVVAQDDDFRQSLRFLLEAEGYRVVAASTVPDPLEAAPSYDCLVMDDRGADRRPGAVSAPTPGRPVVLLVDRLGERPGGSAASYVEKPLLGDRLAAAVRSVLVNGATT